MKPFDTVYILGPMTGYPDNNRPAFRRAAKQIRAMGYNVISPDELDQDAPAKGEAWADYLARDIPFLLKSVAGVAIPGWRESRGATLEATILNALGRPVLELIDGKLRPVPPQYLPHTVHPV